MKPSDLLKQNVPPIICIWGPAGTSKTALIAQLHKGYVCDMDGGMRTAATLHDKFFDVRQEITFDTFVDRPPAAPNAFLNVKKKLLNISKQCNEGTWPFEALGVDSLTGLCRAAQLHILATIAPDKYSSPDMFNVPILKHYNHIINAVESILTIIRSLKKLVIVTAHECMIETADDILIRIMSATKNHGANKIPWLFDELWHSRKQPAGQGKMNYIVGGSGNAALSTRTRSGMNKDVTHNDIGLRGILEMIGYKYEKASTD